MKKYLIFLSAVLLASCSVVVPKTHERIVEKGFADYRPFGIYISPDPCPAEYEPIGSFTISVVPALYIESQATKRDAGKYQDGIYNTRYVNGKPAKVEQISYSNLLGIAVADAAEKDADGISNLEIRDVYDTQGHLTHHEITGLYIKKK